jgi:uncharacterized Zn-finger protein
MKHSVQAELKLGSSVFTRCCAYCGARFQVVLAHLAEADHAEDYACPDCGKLYEAEASAEPQVRLVQHRTDGKRDRYQETMF